MCGVGASKAQARGKDKDKERSNTMKQICLVMKGSEAPQGAVVRLNKTSKGDPYLKEEAVVRAAKRLGCPVEKLRLAPGTGYAIGTERLDVVSGARSHYPLFGVIGTFFFDINK